MVASAPAAMRLSLMSGVRPTVLMMSEYMGIRFSVLSCLLSVVLLFIWLS